MRSAPGTLINPLSAVHRAVVTSSVVERRSRLNCLNSRLRRSFRRDKTRAISYALKVTAIQLGEPAHPTLAFGDFRLDTVGRRLIRGAEGIPLPERLFGVLSLLVQSNGTVVEKETFAAVVWPDVVMTGSNLAQHIYLLRQLLRETARDRSYSMAAAGRGYRLTVPVFAEAPARASTGGSTDTLGPRSLNKPACMRCSPSMGSFRYRRNFRRRKRPLRAVSVTLPL
jgi:DNA-binding winged helix-turn-helix (wHTH) protein